MDGVVTIPYDENAVIEGIKCQTCGQVMSLNRGRFPICDDCLKVLREIIKERRMSNGCKVKTRHFWMIHKELENAIEKHPEFCSAIIDPASSKSWIEMERQIKLRNECGPEYADCILMEEMAEAFSAYEHGDKAHALQELAQCGAVILRIMETIEKEI